MTDTTVITDVANLTVRQGGLPTDPELAGLSDDVEVARFLLDVVNKDARDLDVSQSIIAGEVTRTIQGASQVSITIHDQDRRILKSGMLQGEDGKLRAVDVRLDGMYFRVVGVQKRGDDLVLLFEDRDVARLRAKKGPRKAASRAKVTRAQYILTLVRSVKARKIPVVINELKKKQPIAPPSASQTRRLKKASARDAERDASRGSGFDSGTKVTGVTKGQLDNIAVFLEESELLDASERAQLAGLVAGFGESGWNKAARNGDHVGVFQSNQISDLRGQSHYFLIGGRSFRSGGAIQTAKDHPDWTVGRIASYVEVSDASGQHYDKYRAIARRVLDAWSGGTGSATSSRSASTYYKRYEFKVDKKENYWDAIQRLAKEVEWRAFMSGGTFYYISETDLFKSRARYRFSERSDGIIGIDFSQDVRKKIDKATVTARINRWAVPPGTVVVIDDLGTASGRWLVVEITRNLFSAEANIQLQKPVKERAEPRSEVATRSTGGSTHRAPEGSPKNIIDNIVLPIALENGINRTVAENDAANARHGPTISGGRSWHQGPPEDQWAADMSNGQRPTREMDKLAAALAKEFGIKWSGAGLVNHSDGEYNYQLIYRTNEGGDHFNHVHFGVQRIRKLNASRPGYN